MSKREQRWPRRSKPNQSAWCGAKPLAGGCQNRNTSAGGTVATSPAKWQRDEAEAAAAARGGRETRTPRGARGENGGTGGSGFSP